MVASMTMAAARPTPMIWKTISPSVANSEYGHHHDRGAGNDAGGRRNGLRNCVFGTHPVVVRFRMRLRTNMW
jgi:hypothetical protein